MRDHGWLQSLLWFLLAGLVASQVPTPQAITTEATLTLTEALFPTSLTATTITFINDGAATTTTEYFFLPTTLSTTITASSATATYSGLEYLGLRGSEITIAPGYNISLHGVAGPAFCYFPTSGQWSLLPRILFYLTLVFALVARRHEWLVGGALAAALAYSSLAAVQMAFQVWTGRDIAELDFLSLTSVLGTSCILAAPLMNWSSTIQRLGLPKDGTEFEKKKDYGSTRVVLLFWNLIVVVGFLAAVAQFLLPGNGVVLFFKSEADDITCVPPNGYLDATAGQLPLWDSFWLTSEFISQNNCVDPCSTATTLNTLFRSSSELQTVSMYDVAHVIETQTQSKKVQRNEAFVSFTFGLLVFLVPFIILQSLLHVFLFWRSNPQKARWKIYRRFLQAKNIRMDANTKKSAWTRLAFSAAWLFYIFATFVLLVAAPLFVMTIAAMELALYWTPQAETNTHLDQWGVFAVTGLVLTAAFIARLIPGHRRRTKFENLKKKKQFYDKKLEELLLPGGAESMKVMPRYSKPMPILEIFTFSGQMRKTAPFWGKRLGRWTRRAAVNLWLGIWYHHHMSVEFWRHPDRKPKKRDEAGSDWKYKKSQEEEDDEILYQINSDNDAKDVEQWQKDAKRAKELFQNEWERIVLQGPTEGSRLGNTDMSEINPQVGATDVYQGFNAGLQPNPPGLSDSSSPRVVGGRGLRRSVEVLISPANIAYAGGLKATPTQPSQHKGTRNLTRYSQRRSHGSAAMSNSPLVSPAPAAVELFGHRNNHQVPSVTPDTIHYNSPASSISNDLSRRPSPGQHQRRPVPSLGADRHQTFEHRSPQSSSSLARKALPKLPMDSTKERHRSGNHRSYASRGDLPISKLSPHVSSPVELEGQTSRQEYGSRSPDIYMATSSTSIQAQYTRSRAKAQSPPEETAPLLFDQPDVGEQLDSTSPNIYERRISLDPVSRDSSIHYDIDESYSIAEAHASDRA